MSNQPVAKVPAMAPAQLHAYTRPATRPAWSQSRTASRVTCGEIVPKATIGAKNSTTDNATIRIGRFAVCIAPTALVRPRKIHSFAVRQNIAVQNSCPGDASDEFGL